MTERPIIRLEGVQVSYLLVNDPAAAAQRAQMRKAEREGTRIAVKFIPDHKPWAKK